MKWDKGIDPWILLTMLIVLIGIATGSSCRIVNVEVHAAPGSTVWIDGVQQQADKPMDFKGGGLSVPLLP